MSKLSFLKKKLTPIVIAAVLAASLTAGVFILNAGATEAIYDAVSGKDPQRKITCMRQLKAVTPETLKNAAEIYRKAWENGNRSTAGSAAAINANADLYDVILNPFRAKDLLQGE